MDDRNPRPIQDLRAEIDALELPAKGLALKVASAHPKRSLLAFQAEWHIRAILYHLRHVFDHYSVFVHEVSKRAGTGASVLVMFAPSFQELLFEFYALVNICRISVDNLRLYLGPHFAPGSDQLPKSIRDVLAGKTNCPVYNSLVGQPLLDYLLDIRNCLVHYRSLATSDNAIVVEEGIDTSREFPAHDSFFLAMARAQFRRDGENGISVNVYVPDEIFETDAKGNKRLSVFTYSQRWSLVSTARNFAELGVRSLTLVLECLRSVPDSSFEYSAKRRR
jgi:hypothetical protein